MQSFDVKDAFLTVPQRKELCVLLEGTPYKVHKCLPGQQPAAAWWSEQLSSDLRESGLIPDEACPAAFGKPGLGATVHVDDGIMAGDEKTLRQVGSILKQKYKLELSDIAGAVGTSVKFLKKEMVITDMGMEVRVSPKYLEKICATLDLKKTRTRKTPCSSEISQPDTTQELNEEMASRYRGAVGSFLYLSPDRPDCQWTIAHLARAMSKPTWKMFKHACHLAEYLQCASESCQVVKWSYPGRSCLDDRALSREEAIALQKEHMGDHDLMEAVSDSDWAGHYDRISSSCGHIFLNGNMVHGFVRKQGAVSLSSCEAELISCVSTSAEAIHLRHITRTLSSAPCDILCRPDSSSARSLLQKRGVSKIRHLDCKLLWLQRAAQERQLSFGAISTYLNTSDIGTKALTAERYGFLMVRLGFKGFATSSTDKIKLDKLQGRILRLMVLMDALKCADASEPNAMFNFEGVYVSFESVLSLRLFLPAWSLVLLAVVCGCVVGWMIWKYWCAGKGLVFEQHAEQGQNQDEQQHEGEVQHDQQHEGEIQHEQQHEGEVQHDQQHEGEVQHEQ